MSEKPQTDHWSLDKRIPIAMIWTIAIQTAVGVWWASEQAALNREQSRRLDTLEAARNADRVSERMATLEAQMTDVRAAVLRIDERTRIQLENAKGRNQ